MATRNVQVTATLTDGSGAPITGASLDIQYQATGAASFTDAGPATTDANGNASVTVNNLTAPGTYNFQAVYAGDATHDPSTGTLTGFQLKASSKVAVAAVAQ